jgi:hypothetical protein
MDASQYTARLRSVIVYTNARDIAPEKSARIGTNIATKREGATLDIYMEPPPAVKKPEPKPISSFPSASRVVDIAFYDIMKYIQSLNPGPTKASRLMYLWMLSLTAAYNWVSPTASKHIHGVHDTWNWDIRHPLLVTATNQIYSWITYALTQIMPQFITGYNSSTILERERLDLQLTEVQQNGRHSGVQATGKWSEFWSAWTTWFTTRQNDGFMEASIPPTSDVLPNTTEVLDVSDTKDPASFPEPRAWTPLKIGPKTQKYLTYSWNSVQSSCLTADDESTINAAATAYYVDGARRTAEIAEVVTITNTLTDTQKMIAEFWAGGPGSVSPPCIAMVLWNYFMKAYGSSRIISYDTYFFSGLEMAIHVFEAGRLIWGLKKTYMQARPIQEIRASYRGQTIKNGFGESVLGESWTPFQESYFVTPPFADFPSGHSGFSQVFADVMTKWFGALIPKTDPIMGVDLSLLTPVLAGIQTLSFPTFIMTTGCSQIQPGGSVPSRDIVLSWNRWQDIADSAGLSRKYGGIHATSAHTGSQALGRSLHTKIKERWAII